MSFLERLEPVTNIYDCIQQFWNNIKTQQFIATFILCIFIFALIGIELNREGVLPIGISMLFPTNHFHAINLAFTLILVMEVISLIFSISCSLSRALGKQFEIMALILLRDAFKELAELPEPVSIANNLDPLLHIGVSASAALIIFVCLGIYHSIRSQQYYIKTSEQRMKYIISKKIIALFLLCMFTIIGIKDAWLFIFFARAESFFETIYTILIFADVTLVLVSQRFMPSFHAVFRNSGFVIATLIMRLSLSATHPWNAAASVFASVYLLALIWATNHFTPVSVRPQQTEKINTQSAVKTAVRRKVKGVKSKLNKVFTVRRT